MGPITSLSYGAPIDAASTATPPGYSKVNGAVFTAISDGSGGWYIGGQFSQVGNLTRNNLAHILANSR